MKHIFVSYSMRDATWYYRLLDIIGPFAQEQDVRIWSDDSIGFGEDWPEALQRLLRRSQLFIVLLSQNYFSSLFVENHELPGMLAATRERDIKLLPVLVGRTKVPAESAIRHFQFLNDLDKPLDELGDQERDSELLRIGKQIKDAIEALPAFPEPRKASETAQELAAEKAARSVSWTSNTSFSLLGNNIFYEALESLRQKKLLRESEWHE